MTANEIQQRYFKQKGRVTVIQAVKSAFLRMPEYFSGYDIHRQAARELMRPSVYPDTVFRIMRMLRERGQINFKCVDQVNSKYQKL
jgi:Fe2+ or Zn2+ uptake regulation protein